MVTTPDDVLTILRAHIEESQEPVASAVDLADRVEVSRRTVLSRLEQLEASGDVGSKHVGRGRVWWPVDEDLPADPSADPSAEPSAEETPPAGFPSEDRPAEPSADPPADVDDVDGDLDELVAAAAREWDPETDHHEERRRAALAGLQWLEADGGPASASDFKQALYGSHSVPSQSEDTWWRNSVRPALQEAVARGLAKYRHGPHEYRWISLEN